MNQIINTNRAVRVKFDAYTSTTQITQSSNASIYVPFPVKEILITQIRDFSRRRENEHSSVSRGWAVRSSGICFS